jgi:GMP synthase PP-ATPase subunit
MWHFTCERISHEITYVTFHMWKDFTWNYKLQVKFHICEKISHEITSEISHVKGVHINVTNYKWHSTYERFHMKLQITSEISHMGKKNHMKLQVKFHTWKDKDFTWHYKLQSEISHVRERISHEITTEISHV